MVAGCLGGIEKHDVVLGASQFVDTVLHQAGIGQTDKLICKAVANGSSAQYWVFQQKTDHL